MLLPRSGKVALHWQFETGAALRYELERSMQITMAGREKSEQRLLFGLSMKITDVRDGTATIQVTFDRISAVMSGMLDAQYDSASPDKAGGSDVLGQVLGAMVGKSFVMELEPTGRIRTVRGCTELIEAIGKETKDDSGVVAHLAEQFGDREVEAMLEMAFPRVPKDAVAEGGLWKDEGTLSLHRLGEVTEKTKSKVLAIRGETVDWKTRTELANGDGQAGEHGSVAIWSATGEGKVTWDASHGRMTVAKSETRIEAEAHGQEFVMVLTSAMRWAPK